MNGMIIPACNPKGSFASIRCKCMTKQSDGSYTEKWPYPEGPNCKNRVAHIEEGWC